MDLLAKGRYVDADTCVGCHDEEYEYPIYPLFKTKHAVVADPRTPFSNRLGLYPPRSGQDPRQGEESGQAQRHDHQLRQGLLGAGQGPE